MRHVILANGQVYYPYQSAKDCIEILERSNLYFTYQLSRVSNSNSFFTNYFKALNSIKI